MKIIISVWVFVLLLTASKAQIDTSIAKSGFPIEMLFPQGKTKALILSFDDGRTEDRQLVKLMNTYGLVGTFHLNSNKLGTNGYVSRDEIKKLFEGHEVSAHSANHPNLTTLSKIDIVYEIVEDRKELERWMGYPVRGMSYPFGNNNETVIETIKGLGIEYARTVDDSYNFKIPDNFLDWHPTIHLFGKTNYIPNDTDNDKRELAHFYQVLSNFISTKALGLFYIWGHSWELGNKWEETEKCFKLLANNSDIHYTSQISLVDYINAFHNLKFSVDKSVVINPSALTIYFKIHHKTYSILPGKTLVVSDYSDAK